MKAPPTSISILAAVACSFCLSPSTAAAEYLVPPGSSAANQYTEALPTASGARDTSKGDAPHHRSPTQVLGHKHAARLEAQGHAGREAAEFAAETAPAGAVSELADSRQSVEKTTTHVRGQEGEGRVRGEGQPDGGRPAESTKGSKPTAASAQASSGDADGISEILGQATGGSSGNLGPLFPLAVLGTVIWALWFGLRSRRRTGLGR